MTLREKIEHAIIQQPCNAKQLKAAYGGSPAANRQVMEALDQLVRGRVICQRQGVFFTVRSGRADRVIPCVITKLGKGFGFALRDDEQGDIFIPGRNLLGAMPGDRVLVEKFKDPRVPGSDEGEVVAITQQNNELVGTVRRIEGRLQFVPDDCPTLNLTIEHGGDGGAKDGDKAAAQIVHRGLNQADHRVQIAVRFGSSQQAKHCARALLYAHGIAPVFPPQVQQAAQALEGAEVTPADLAGRLDLRGLPVFTIDSAETKDIDDAISLNRTPNGFELGVHIADVAHYVRPDTPLDEEAFARGTSVYYADQVVPMLPAQLSNGICSLNPGVDRLAFSCLMRLDADGNLKDYRFVKSVIQSRVKGVYSEINAILDGQVSVQLNRKYTAVSAQLPAMKELYRCRAALRAARGCMDLESGECKLILDENGRCVEVKKRQQGLSEAMIEEFMLLANQCAAHFARIRQAPFVYRVHEKPNAEKQARLEDLLAACGIYPRFAKKSPSPKELSAILDQVRGTDYERVLHTGMLRCMSKARYEAEPKGHYGLVLQDYAHFTSPIRRYPDLAVHRILADLIAQLPAGQLTQRYAEFARRSAEQASKREIAAQQVERGAESCYKAEWALQHLGQRFEAVISGVTQRGLFLELPNGVEGFVPASSLTSSGTHFTEGVRLSDPLSGKRWSLGDRMLVQLVRADVNQGKVDLEAV